jgi:hypothetical protein
VRSAIRNILAAGVPAASVTRLGVAAVGVGREGRPLRYLLEQAAWLAELETGVENEWGASPRESAQGSVPEFVDMEWCPVAEFAAYVDARWPSGSASILVAQGLACRDATRIKDGLGAEHASVRSLWRVVSEALAWDPVALDAWAGSARPWTLTGDLVAAWANVTDVEHAVLLHDAGVGVFEYVRAPERFADLGSLAMLAALQASVPV